MFDISWTEFLLIGVVALIVIGPKELPTVLRTLGQWTRRLRSMASDFQSQFQEAMREAEMSDLKKQVDDIARDVKNYDPLKEVRSEVETAGQDIQTALEQKPAAEPQDAAAPQLPAGSAAEAAADSAAAATAPTELAAIETSIPAPASGTGDVAAIATGPVTPEAAATEPVDTTGRAG